MFFLSLTCKQNFVLSKTIVARTVYKYWIFACFFFQHRVSLTIPLCFLFIKIAIFPIHGLGTVRALFGLRAIYRHTCTRARVIGPADKSKRLSAEDDVDPRVDNRVSGGHLYTKQLKGWRTLVYPNQMLQHIHLYAERKNRHMTGIQSWLIDTPFLLTIYQ